MYVYIHASCRILRNFHSINIITKRLSGVLYSWHCDLAPGRVAFTLHFELLRFFSPHKSISVFLLLKKNIWKMNVSFLFFPSLFLSVRKKLLE